MRRGLWIGALLPGSVAAWGWSEHSQRTQPGVATPGSPDRGARRIVSGGNPPVEFFFTDDHYRSFRRLEGRPAP